MLSAALINANNEKAEYMTELDSARFKLKNFEANGPRTPGAATISTNSSIPNSTESSRKNSTAVAPQVTSQQPTSNTHTNQLQLENSQLAQILADEKMSSAQLQEQIDNLQDQLKKYAHKVQEMEGQASQASRSESRASVPASLYQNNEETEGLVSQLGGLGCSTGDKHGREESHVYHLLNEQKSFFSFSSPRKTKNSFPQRASPPTPTSRQQ